MQSIDEFVTGQLAAWEVSGTYAMGPWNSSQGAGLRFGVKGQPAITVEFELDGTGAVTRLVAQPLGIFLPKPLA